MRFFKNLFSAIVILGILFPAYAQAQTVEQIKANDSYIWGEGTGMTLKKADNQALQMLVNQISVEVESRFKQFKEQEKSGTQTNYKEKVKSVVKTYSSATLHNTERIVISNEPDAKVFRYIKRKNVNQVFENRKDKIFSFVENARKAVKERRIGDALRYYYWGFTLLKSHPDCNDIRYTDGEGEKHPLITWIPMQINAIFSNLEYHVNKTEQADEMKRVVLNITYNGEPVDNLDYSYWDGRDWSNLINVKDGRGFLEYYGAAADGKEKGRIKTEYIYENQANIDNELKRVMDRVEAIPFRKSYYTVHFDSTRHQESRRVVQNQKRSKAKIAKVSDTVAYYRKLEKVQRAIRRRDYASVRNLFTARGYRMFEKLIQYGNARILSDPDHAYYKFRGGVMARSLPMSFSFQNNHQEFIEDVVFHFNGDEKIKSLSFGLSDHALNSIINKDVWDEVDRMVLINFLEHYKTAYALKRLDYIETIFADDALIITGEVVRVKPNADSRYQSNKIVRYNRQSKQEYIRNLRYSFQSKEYINIQFEESDVRKGGKGGDIYGVQIKQNYYSSNYGDQGWLFLMVDLNDPHEPIIHVRTWQPTKGKQDSIYGLSDF